jgi:hypothetical protein
MDNPVQGARRLILLVCADITALRAERGNRP